MRREGSYGDTRELIGDRMGEWRRQGTAVTRCTGRVWWSPKAWQGGGGKTRSGNLDNWSMAMVKADNMDTSIPSTNSKPMSTTSQ